MKNDLIDSCSRRLFSLLLVQINKTQLVETSNSQSTTKVTSKSANTSKVILQQIQKRLCLL